MTTPTQSAGLYGPEAVLGQTGTPAVSTPVTVYLHGTTTNAALFADNTMAASASNPVTTDTFGNLAFYVIPGLYDLSFTVGGVATTLTVLVEPWFADCLIPTGLISDFGGPTAPAGWQLCDGSAISRTGVTEPLFSVIGTTYGNGDGSTTFNVPDLRGRVTVGVGSVGTNSQPTYAIGDVGGEQNHTLVAGELPAENFPINGSSDPPSKTTEGGSSFQAIVTMPSSTGNVYAIPTTPNAGAGNLLVEQVNSTWDYDTSFVVSSNGSNTPHNTMQPFLAVTKIIKL